MPPPPPLVCLLTPSASLFSRVPVPDENLARCRRRVYASLSLCVLVFPYSSASLFSRVPVLDESLACCRRCCCYRRRLRGPHPPPPPLPPQPPLIRPLVPPRPCFPVSLFWTRASPAAATATATAAACAPICPSASLFSRVPVLDENLACRRYRRRLCACLSLYVLVFLCPYSGQEPRPPPPPLP